MSLSLHTWDSVTKTTESASQDDSVDELDIMDAPEDPLAYLVTAANAYYVHSSQTAFLTLPEALEHVYKVDATGPYPKTFTEAMKR